MSMKGLAWRVAVDGAIPSAIRISLRTGPCMRPVREKKCAAPAVTGDARSARCNYTLHSTVYCVCRM